MKIRNGHKIIVSKFERKLLDRPRRKWLDIKKIIQMIVGVAVIELA